MKGRVEHGRLYLADLHPRFGTEPGKMKPVLVIQSDLLSGVGHPSAWILPLTTRLTGASALRVVLPAGIAGNREECEVMVDQSRSIDNRRFQRPLGRVPASLLREVKQKLRKVGDLD